MKLKLTDFSIRFPHLILVLAVAVTAFLALQFPKVKFDNDPENMLDPEEHVRLFNDEVKEKYSLYDFVIVGIVNETDEDGVFNVGTLGRIHELTHSLLRLRKSESGLPSVSERSSEKGSEIDLTPENLWSRILNTVFMHNPNRLFDEDGDSAIISSEIISPSVVDNIKQAEFGSLKIEYLMEEAPKTREAALEMRDDAMNNPLYKGTLVSEDGKALCLYIPIKEKTFSYNVAALVDHLTRDWPEEDHVYITGLPVAEDTFGVEMLVQMATSAPMAGVAIFLLLLFFFRRLSLIIAPMLVAVVSVVCTMGLLIGLGFDVHIMSSMIAIFLMPIAVADSVHILSEFFDVYHRFGNKRDTIRHVIGHLFMPMLYTSLTTIAGFASLALTPIPPVKIFGLHVAFGVGLAWILTMTFIPAYIMLFVPVASLDKRVKQSEGGNLKKGVLDLALERLGGFSYRHYRLIIAATLIVFAVSVYGITKIQVNDNPVKWFTSSHPIRVADKVLNDHFGGTYTAYLTMEPTGDGTVHCRDIAESMKAGISGRFGEIYPEETSVIINKIDEMKAGYSTLEGANDQACFVELINTASALDKMLRGPWTAVSQEFQYLEAEGLTFANIAEKVKANASLESAAVDSVMAELKGSEDLTGYDLIDAALAVCDSRVSASFEEYIYDLQAELTAAPFKRPEVLRYVEELQKQLMSQETVGKTTSVVDALKKASYELSYTQAPVAGDAEVTAATEARNNANYAVPASVSAAAQVYTQLEGMKKKDSLFHLVKRDYREANIWIQLTSGDNRDMEQVVLFTEEYVKNNPPPAGLNLEWAGLTYLNVVWQDKMVKGMLSSLISSFVVVLIMMMVLFRSPLYGILSMVPLSVTIIFIYGLIGHVGKEYDMPVAVLSALTLGLSVDFAIHFLERARELQKKYGNWREACLEMFREPAKAISRNAITISIGFTPLLFAPLVPYKTVGFFLAAIMAASWVATLFILAALVTWLQKYIFRNVNENGEGSGS